GVAPKLAHRNAALRASRGAGMAVDGVGSPTTRGYRRRRILLTAPTYVVVLSVNLIAAVNGVNPFRAVRTNGAVDAVPSRVCLERAAARGRRGVPAWTVCRRRRARRRLDHVGPGDRPPRRTMAISHRRRFPLGRPRFRRRVVGDGRPHTGGRCP